MYKLYNHLGGTFMVQATVDKPGFIDHVVGDGTAVARVEFPKAGTSFWDNIRHVSELSLVLHFMAADTDGLILVGRNHLSAALGFNVERPLRQLKADGWVRYAGSRGGTFFVIKPREARRLKVVAQVRESTQDVDHDPTWEHFQDPANRQRVMDNITEQEAGDILDIVNPIGSLKHLHSH